MEALSQVLTTKALSQVQMTEALSQVSTAEVLLTTKEALSGIFGSVSLATWIFLLVPQLILNYKTGSAEGISLTFLTVWLIGDLTNLAGAMWAGLVPTVIASAIYFCFADFVLISQCMYYNQVNARRHVSREDEPLLGRQRSSDTVGLPGSRRRSSARRPSRTSDFGNDMLSKIAEEDNGSSRGSWIQNAITIALVALAGTAGWVIAWQSGVWTPTPETAHVDIKGDPIGAKILGYFSAACYLGARIPQIVKNHRERSCEGLALLFFLLSLMGNATYGAGIIFHSQEKEYLLKTLPWLIGSLGTMVEDGIIFLQFMIYAPIKRT